MLRIDDLKNAANKYAEHIPEPFDTLIEKIGFEGLYELSEELGGGSVYVPTTRNMFKKCLICAIIDESDGYNHKILAKKYDFSVKGVRGFLKKN